MTSPYFNPPAPPQTSGPDPSVTALDPRGARFTAAATAVVLVVVLLTAPRPVGVVLLALQAALFALGACSGVQHGPWAVVFRRVVRPRLGPPGQTEDPRPARFAQAVGLGFCVVGLVGYVVGAGFLGAVATGLALVAALLNAVLGLCLGCELYLLLRRATGAPSST